MTDTPSPCRKVCKIIESRNLAYCSGCGRSLNEISRWSEMTDQERALTVKRAKARMSERDLYPVSVASKG